MDDTKRDDLLKLKSIICEVLLTAACYDSSSDDGLQYQYNIKRLHRFIVRAKLGHGMELVEIWRDLFVHIAKQNYWMVIVDDEKMVAGFMLEWFKKNIHKNYEIPAYWQGGGGR